MPRTGEIGEQIFDQVEKLVADGMNRTEAFAKISADSGRRAGTLARDAVIVGRRRRTTAQAGGGDIDRIANALVGNIEQLTNAVKAQSREVAELRSRLDGIRRLLD